MAHVSLVIVPVLVAVCSCSESSKQAKGRAEATDTTESAMQVGGQLRVSNVMIGRKIGAGNHVTDPTFQFTPQDTVYVSVATAGSGGSDHLTAAWRSQTGEILQQSSEPVPPAGENAVFRLSQAKGLKPGTYKVILFLGNDSADAKVFVVKK